MNGNPRPVIPDTISGQLRAGLSPEFLSPYADGEVANRPVLLHQLSDATRLSDVAGLFAVATAHGNRLDIQQLNAGFGFA